MEDLKQLMKKLPKVELHLHLEGSVMPQTVIDLAKKNNVPLPAYEKPEDLYDFDSDLSDFLKVYSLVCESIVAPEDFQRVTFECLLSCHNNGARYVELFFSPQAHYAFGVDFATSLKGVVAGIAKARDELGIECKLIPAVNRELDPKESIKLVQEVIAHRCEEIVGVGLDFYERPNPPELHVDAFNLARDHGLMTTAHAGEDGPAENVEKSLSILGCDRIDHGYAVVDSPALIQRCIKEGISFTVCPSTTVVTTKWNDLTAENHAIKRMAASGLSIMINSDDPPMMKTDLANEYVLLVRDMGFSLADVKDFVLNGIDASWLPDDKKCRWRKDWSEEIDVIFNDYAKT